MTRLIRKVRRRLRSIWTFLWIERVGYFRPLSVSTDVAVDRRLREAADRDRLLVKRALMLLDADSGIFRRTTE